MNQEELERNQEILNALNARLHRLKVRKAQLGISADPSIDIEIADLENQIRKLEKKVSPKPIINQWIDLKRVPPIFYIALISFIVVLLGYFILWSTILNPPTPTCKVFFGQVAVQAFPDFNSSIVARLPMGMEFTPESKSPDGFWFKIPSISGIPAGWVTTNRDFVDCSNLDSVPVATP